MGRDSGRDPHFLAHPLDPEYSALFTLARDRLLSRIGGRCLAKYSTQCQKDAIMPSLRRSFPGVAYW